MKLTQLVDSASFFTQTYFQYKGITKIQKLASKHVLDGHQLNKQEISFTREFS